MANSINNFLNKPLNVSNEKHGTGVIKRVLKNKQSDTYYIISINLSDTRTIEAKSIDYSKTSPLLDVGSVVDVKYFTVGKNTFCEIQDNILVTANEDRNKKFIYFACVGIMAVVLFGIFMGAKLIF